jgi:hypothetical protein
LSPTEFRRVLRGIRAAQSSVFCVVFCRPLFIILSFFAWPLHCLPFFDIWLPITLLASTNFSYLLTYTRTTVLSFHCNIYVKIYWRLQLFGIMGRQCNGQAKKDKMINSGLQKTIQKTEDWAVWIPLKTRRNSVGDNLSL